MSDPLMRECMKALRYGGPDLPVLMAFAMHADPDGTNCFPSLETVAEYAGVSVATAKRASVRLQADGALICLYRSRHRGVHSRWKIDRDKLQSGPREHGERGMGKPGRARPKQDGRAQGDTNCRAQDVAEPGARYAETGRKMIPDLVLTKSDSAPPSLAATAALPDEEEYDWSLTAETALTLALREVDGRRHKSTLNNANEANRFLETDAGLLAKKEYESPDWRALGNSPWDRTFRLLDLWQEANRIELKLPPRPERIST